MFSVIRTEKKYQIDFIQKSVLMNRLSNVIEMDAHGGIDGYKVRSLYFDSINDDDLFDKLDGLECRKKIRLRIYSPEQTQVKLEMKQKQGASQQKKTMWISRELAQEMIEGNYGGLLELDSDLAIEIYQIMQTGLYSPKCIIEYSRVAFVEDCNNIRITFDSEIGVNTSCENFFKNDLCFIPVLNEPVLEVKYNGFLLSSIKQIINMADMPEISVSKYALSRQVAF